MTIPRAAAADYLHSQYDNLAREIGQTAYDDSADGYGPDIDQALRALGIDETEIATGEVENSQGLLYYALADFFALTRFARQLATKTDIGAPTQYGIDGDRPRVFEQVMDLLEDADERLGELGYPSGIPPDTSTSRVAALFEVS